MRVTVRVFARLRELVGASELVRDVPDDATVRVVWQGLVDAVPALAPYTSSISAARNLEYVPFATRVADGDEIAFLPPVSGGAPGHRRCWTS
jgi:molybdopterin converting factor small subunit